MSLLFFDYDGVIVDSLETETRYFVDACHQVGIEEINTSADMAELSLGNFYQGMLDRGIPEEKIDAAMKIYCKKDKDASYHLDTYPTMPELVRELAEKYPLYIVTSNVSASVKKVLDQNYVTGVKEIIGADVEKSKVKKFHRIMEQYPGERTVFVSDSKGDMIEGKEAGIDVRVAVTWGWQEPWVVASGNPDHIFDSPEGLRAWFRGFMTAEGKF
ncbi:MAG: HAD-IA family hydrolase [Bacillota bacterium]|nr:HAD-IA family hydrolase [Bacillota bacterium]